MCCNKWFQLNRGSVSVTQTRSVMSPWLQLLMDLPITRSILPHPSPALQVKPWRRFILRNSLSLLSSLRLLSHASGFFPAVLCYDFAGNLFWRRSVETITAGKKGEMGKAGKSALSAAVAVETTFTQVLLARSPSRIRLARLIDRFGNTHKLTDKHTNTGAHKHNSGKMIKSVAHLLVCTLATNSSPFPVYWDIVHATICPFFMFAVKT